VKTHFKYIFLFICFTSQAIDLTIAYLKYETVISITDSAPYRPAISLCFNSKQDLFEIIKRNGAQETFGDFFYRNTICRNGTYFGNCWNKSLIVESLTPFAFKCFTLFSDLLGKRISYDESETPLVYLKSLFPKFIIHSSKSPPHLFTELFNLKFGSLRQYSLIAITENLLQFPYETNCYPYENNIHNTNSPKSYEDCVVKYMQNLEKNNSLYRKRWSYASLNSDNLILKNKTINYTQFMPTIMINKCKKSCFNENYRHR
jgi:hypothetical protein